MAGRPSKKALREALVPLRKAAENYAMEHLVWARPCANPKPVEFAGYQIDVNFIRRPRVVCGVPFPYAVLWIEYVAKRGEQKISGENGGEFVDRFFRFANFNEEVS